MSTINLAENVSNATRTEPVSINGGAYFLAASSTGDIPPGIELFLNVGASQEVPYFGSIQTMSKGLVVTLPDCTVSAQVSTGGRLDMASVSLAYIGPVTVSTQTSLAPPIFEPIDVAE